MTRRIPRDLVLTGLLFAAVWLGGLQVGPWADARISDVPVYRGYAQSMAAGDLPYRDIVVEYPPLAVLVFRAAGTLGAGWHQYSATFGALMMMAGLACLVLIRGLAGTLGLDRRRRLGVLTLFALSPLLLGAIVRTHFDLVPTALVLGALLALVRGRDSLSFGLLGVGAMTKVFPALMLPMWCAYLWGLGRRGSVLRGVAAFGAVVVALSAPFLVIDGQGYVDSFRFQVTRPVQIESTPASIVLALGAIDATQVGVTGTDANPDEYRSQGVDAPPAALVAGLTGALGAMAMAGAALAAFGAGRRQRRLAGSPAAAFPEKVSVCSCAFATLLAAVALGKVLSPQFLIWLVPLAALLSASGFVRAAAAVGAACVLTLIEFPALYERVVALDTGPVLVVAARNTLLIAALAIVSVALAARGRAPITRPGGQRAR